MPAAFARISLPAAAVCGLIRLYRLLFGPVKHLLGLQGCCRFTPTCSQYCEEAIRAHGLGRGLSLGLRRLLRCHPWGAFGPDPIPPARTPSAR